MYVFARGIMLSGVLLAFNLPVSAQTPTLSSLKTSLQKSHADTAQVKLLLQLSTYYNGLAKPSPADISNALAYAHTAENLSNTLSYPRGTGNSYMTYAQAYRLKKDSSACNGNVHKAITLFLKNNLYRDAAEAYLKGEEYYQAFGGTDLNVRIAWYEKAFPIFAQVHAYDRQEATLKILGDFYQVLGKYPKALEYLLQAQKLERYVQPGDKESLYDLLGGVYVTLGNLNKGLEYGLAAVKIVEQAKDTSMQACAVYNRVGHCYYQSRQTAQARLYYEKALAVAVKLRDVDTQVGLYVNVAHTMIIQEKYNECIAMLKGVVKKYPGIASNTLGGVNNCLLKCYIKLKRYKEAKVYADKLEAESLRINALDNDQQIIQTLLTAYYVVTKQGVPARKHLAQLQKVGDAQQSPFVKSIAYQLAAQLDSTENNFASAYSNYLIADRLKDSIWNGKQSRQVAQLHIQFETEKKDQELRVKEERIRLLNNQSRLQRINLEQEKTTQTLIIGGAALLLILLGISLNGYRLKRGINRQLQSQRKQIEQKNESLTQLVRQKDGLLEEKEWLMKEIHHRVKNNLQIVISLLSTQSSYLDNDIAYNAIRESQHRMQSISLIHQKLYQSDNLALVDIHAYISDLVEYLRDSFDTGIRIEFETDIAAAELDVTRAVPLGLILNEAITNAIKYAFPNCRAGKITISLKNTGENAFALKIHDDGVGFPATVDITKSKSLGMSLMRGLSKQLGGSLKVASGPGITIAVDFVNETLLKAV